MLEPSAHIICQGLWRSARREGRVAASQRGEIVGLLGPNGAGKTTCFYRSWVLWRQMPVISASMTNR